MLKIFHHEDTGQDLVEYALVATMIALGACAAMGIVASEINNVFSSVAVKFKAYGS
ncbi:MAG: Flp family type IVb pilin [Acidobacteriia bacterium]|nr:Flp family type IVb pilin [Terriglobia bacterium]